MTDKSIKLQLEALRSVTAKGLVSKEASIKLLKDFAKFSPLSKSAHSSKKR